MKLKRIVSAVMAGVLAVTTAVSGLTLSAGAVSEKVTGSGSSNDVTFTSKYLPSLWNVNNTRTRGFLAQFTDYLGDYEGKFGSAEQGFGIAAYLDENDIITLTVRFDNKEENLQMTGSIGDIYENERTFEHTYEPRTSVKEILDTEKCTIEELSTIQFCDLDNVLDGVDYFEWQITVEPGTTDNKVDAPTTVKASTVSPTSTKLTWKSTADSFNIYRATSKSGTYKKIGTSESAGYTDKDLTKGKTYYYKVTAVSGGKESEFSKIVSAKACAPAPTSVKAAKSADGKAKLTWKKASGAEGYEIFMAESSGGKFSKIKTVTKGTTIGVTKSGLTSGKTYYFKVRSFITVNGKKVYSGYSKTVKVKV